MTKKTVFLIIFSLIFIMICSLFGPMKLNISNIIHSYEARNIWTELRLPRILLGFLCGSGLAVSGMSFQSVFRNPLAEPFTLGISGGAVLGCALYVTLGINIYLFGFSLLSVFAFLSAFLSVIIVYGLTCLKQHFKISDMLLAGIGINFFFSAIILFLQYFAGEYNLARIMRWTMGGLDINGFLPLLGIIPFYITGLIIIYRNTDELNLLSVSEEIATSKGVNISKVKKSIFFSVSLLVGAICSVSGPIGFVGMICPHIIRKIFGFNNKTIFLPCIFFGGLFLVFCDTIARTVLSPAELPVGIITSLLGGPFFIYLLIAKKQ